jgi:hypothetical protein
VDAGDVKFMRAALKEAGWVSFYWRCSIDGFFRIVYTSSS